MIAVLFSDLISGIADNTTGFSPVRAWQLRQPTTGGVFGSFNVSAVSIDVRFAGHTVLSGGCLATPRRAAYVMALDAGNRSCAFDVVVLVVWFVWLKLTPPSFEAVASRI
jgi:hypothetical protein